MKMKLKNGRGWERSAAHSCLFIVKDVCIANENSNKIMENSFILAFYFIVSQWHLCSPIIFSSRQSIGTVFYSFSFGLRTLFSCAVIVTHSTQHSTNTHIFHGGLCTNRAAIGLDYSIDLIPFKTTTTNDGII